MDLDNVPLFALREQTRRPAPGPPALERRSQRKAALLEIALASLLYEITLKRAANTDGSYDCQITASALQLARVAMEAT